MGRASTARGRSRWAAGRASRRLGTTARLAGAAALLLACGDSSTGPDSDAIGRLEITPAEQEVPLGESRTLTLTVYDLADAPMTVDEAPFWSSSDPAIADVGPDGTVTTAALGEVQIAASLLGKSATARLTVVPIPVAAVQVTPGELSLRVGQTGTLAAQPVSGSGAPLDRPVTWGTTDAAVATVNDAGVVTARGVGTTQITAQSEGATGTATVTVTAAAIASVTVTPSQATVGIGQSTTLGAVVTDERGQRVTNVSVAWSSANDALATVNSEGRVTGVAAGSTKIRATAGGVTGEATVNVTPGPASTVTVNPSERTLQVGQTADLTATVRDASGNVLSTPVTWSSNATGVATVSGSGVVTAQAPGVAVITAAAGDARGTSVITVVPRPVGSVTITPNEVALFPTQQRQLMATVRADDGTELTGRAVTWSSSNPAVAIVSGTGLVTAIVPGEAEIRAEAEGKRGTARVVVSLVPVGSVEVRLQNSTIRAGEQTTASATVRDAQGNPLSGRQVSWSSTNGGVASVNSTGVVTGHSPGSTNIRATVDGVSGQAELIVTPAAPPVTPSRIEPVNVPDEVDRNDTENVTVRVVNAGGTPVPNVLVHFVTTQPGSGTFLDNNVRTNQQGRVTVRWRFDTPRGDRTAVAEVRLPEHPTVPPLVLRVEVEDNGGGPNGSVQPIGSIEVSPAVVQLFPTQQRQLTATVRAEDGTPLAGRTLSWSSTNGLVASISSDAIVTALLPGEAEIRAEAEGKRGTARVLVSLIPVSRVDVTLSRSTIEVGEQATATAVARDAQGNALTGRTTTFSSSDELAATVNANGVATGRAPGVAQIRATVDGVTGAAPLTVTAPPPLVPSRIEASSVPGTVARNATAEVTVRVLGGDRPVPNVRVHFEPRRRSGEFLDNDLRTDADGRVTARWRFSGPRGDRVATAVVRLPDHPSVPSIELQVAVEDDD